MSYDTDPFRGEFDSLEEFADRVSDVLKCPVTIEDANHRLIAYSAHDDYTDPARTATIISRRVPEKIHGQRALPSTRHENDCSRRCIFTEKIHGQWFALHPGMKIPLFFP